MIDQFTHIHYQSKADLEQLPQNIDQKQNKTKQISDLL
jgi:hypothetical protein